MSKEQIEEMARVMANGRFIKPDRNQILLFAGEAETLYNAGYRKQSEPFSCSHEKGGEWVQLPCKVGDIIYVISQMKDKRILPFINEFEVTSISIKKKSIVIYHEMNGYIKTFKQTDFGKTVFLTKKEAETKMKGGE